MKNELQDLIHECTTELNEIEQRINELPSLDKMRLYLTNYALIKACGTLEYVYRSIIADFFDQSPLTQIHTYIEKTVRSGSMSATYDNMSGLLGKFDDRWRNDFKNLVQQHANSQRIISASNSLVNNRHLFAHGQAPTASFMDIYHYYQDTLELIQILDAVVR